MAPPPYDYCDLNSAFPVTQPYVPRAGCWDCGGCVVVPSRAVVTVITLIGLFILSGGFAARLGKTDSILKATIPALMAVTFFLILMASNRIFLWWPTLLMGVVVLVGAAIFSAAGAALAGSDA
jgi:hypothetical protein